MRLSPISLMGSSYADNSLTWSAQRTLNWLPETAEVEGTRTPIKFADPPGLRAVVDLGTGSPIRGLENVEGKLFAVSGTSLFEISTAFGVTNRGNIPGVTRVSMAHNKQGGAVAANELVIANGLSGYVYNTNTTNLVQITDDAFQGATTVDYVDGYITFTDPQGRFWGHSALNQATSFSSIDRYDAESAPDPIISHIVSHREVMVFGTRTIEFFRNTGAATGTFQRVDGTELEVGICATHARSRVDNSVCWVSDSLEIFRLEGHSPQRISTRPIEQLLATVNPANIFTYAWEDRGHKVFYVTAPEAFTIGFDFASGMWHERQTFDIPRWRVNALVPWNGYWIAGDFSNGLLYVLDWDTHHENGLPLVRERASGYTHGGQNKVLAPYVELLFDTGTDGITEPEISGDVPDGFVGNVVSGEYLISGGIAPYSVAVQSGTFPAGLTLGALVNNGDGTYSLPYSGTYTTEADYSWTIGGTDSFGQEFSIADTAQVTMAPPEVLGLKPKVVSWWDFESDMLDKARGGNDFPGTGSFQAYGSDQELAGGTVPLSTTTNYGYNLYSVPNELSYSAFGARINLTKLTDVDNLITVGMDNGSLVSGVIVIGVSAGKWRARVFDPALATPVLDVSSVADAMIGRTLVGINFIFNGSTQTVMELRVDGVTVGTDIDSAGISQLNGTYVIGTRAGGGYRPAISQMFWAHYSLTDDEWTYIHNGGNKRFYADFGTVVYGTTYDTYLASLLSTHAGDGWKFNETAGTTAANVGALAPLGAMTLQNGAAFTNAVAAPAGFPGSYVLALDGTNDYAETGTTVSLGTGNPGASMAQGVWAWQSAASADLSVYINAGPLSVGQPFQFSRVANQGSDLTAFNATYHNAVGVGLSVPGTTQDRANVWAFIGMSVYAGNLLAPIANGIMRGGDANNAGALNTVAGGKVIVGARGSAQLPIAAHLSRAFCMTTGNLSMPEWAKLYDLGSGNG